MPRYRDDARLPARSPESELALIVLSLGSGEYRVFADRCPHNGKQLTYIPEDRKLRCYSGMSHFDLRGVRIQGPAEGNLQSYPARREGKALIIEL